MTINLLKTMRPRQWTKNLLVYLPFVFTLKQYWQPFTPKMYELLAVATSAFVLFCILSGAVYIINDLTDIEKDRRHPRKRFRPLASGTFKKSHAIAALVVILVIVVPLSFLLNVWFGVIAVVYLANNLLYSYVLKNQVILDVLSVSGGFVLRAVAGAAAIQVPASHWLFVCTALLSLFISFGKRRHELLLLENDATNHRAVLKEYSRELLDEMIAVTTASFVMAYSLYTFSAENLPPNRAMMLTIPFALYIVFRLLYLVHVKKEGGSPEEMVLRDKPLFVALVSWGLVSLGILYVFGRV
ncbi:MAG: decaprenyl-phosphate phosphoribosyltransferase [Chloroflexi bacterium]|nr:decaprenyl-phosphate phosphoribosyltransferase [Chloroflexota bacterium]